MRMNKQGVRDLNDFGKKKPKPSVAAEPAVEVTPHAAPDSAATPASPESIVELAPTETASAAAAT